MSKVQFSQFDTKKVSERQAIRPLPEKTSRNRGVTNKRCIENIHEYWAVKGYEVTIDLIYKHSTAILESDMVNGLPLALWKKRGGGK